MKVLAVGAHPDDIELGCGGTLAAHAQAGDTVTMLVMTEGGNGPGDTARRVDEQQRAAARIGADLLWGGLPDGAVGAGELAALHVVEAALRATGATRLYTHGENDTHQDHRAVALLSLGAARNLREVLAYHSPSSRQFHPDLYVDITGTLQHKLDALACHQSQVDSSSRVDLGLVRAEALYCGGQARTGAAEGFALERMVLGIAAPAVVPARQRRSRVYAPGAPSRMRSRR